MSLTHQELCAKLNNTYDVDDICEMLQLEVEEILERFDDKVTQHFEKLAEEFEDE